LNIGELKRTFEKTQKEDQPDGVLVLDPGIYYDSNEDADGALALFAFIRRLSEILYYNGGNRLDIKTYLSYIKYVIKLVYSSVNFFSCNDVLV
jgi:hypothetical protein